MEYSGASAFPKPANLTSTYEYTPHELGDFIIFLRRWELEIRASTSTWRGWKFRIGNQWFLGPQTFET